MDADDREVLLRGLDYQQLKETKGYERLLLFMRDYCNGALADLEGADTSDAAAVQDKVRTWKVREQVFQAIQAEVTNAIHAKERWIEDAKSRDIGPLHPEFATIEEQYAGYAPDPDNPDR